MDFYSSSGRLNAQGGTILALQQAGNSYKHVSVPGKFVDRVIEFLPKGLRGGVLESWLLKVGLDPKIYNERKDMLEAFKYAVDEHVKEGGAIPEDLKKYAQSAKSLNMREIRSIVSDDQLRSALMGNLLEKTVGHPAHLAKMATEQEKWQEFMHGKENEKFLSKNDSSKYNLNGLKFKSIWLTAQTTQFNERYTTRNGNHEPDATVTGVDGRDIKIDPELYKDLGRSSFSFHPYNTDNPLITLDRGVPENTAEMIKTDQATNLRKLFSQLPNLPGLVNRVINESDIDQAVIDFSRVISQSVFAGITGHPSRVNGGNAIPLVDNSNLFVEQSVDYKLEMQGNGTVKVTALCRDPLLGLQLTEGGSKYCDPRESFEKQTIEILFTPACLRDGGTPHFEVLSAGYDRRLVPIQIGEINIMDTQGRQGLGGWMTQLGKQVVASYVPELSNAVSPEIVAPKAWGARSLAYLPKWSITGKEAILKLELSSLDKQQQRVASDAFRSAVYELTKGTVDARTCMSSDRRGNMSVNLHAIGGGARDSNAVHALFEGAQTYVEKWESFLEKTEGGARLPKRHKWDMNAADFEKVREFKDVKSQWTKELNTQMEVFLKDDFAHTDARMKVADEVELPIVLGSLGVDLTRADVKIIDLHGAPVSGLDEATDRLGEIRGYALYSQFKVAANNNPDGDIISTEDVANASMDFSKMMHQGIFGDLSTNIVKKTGVIAVPDTKLNPARPEYIIKMQPNGEVIVTAHVKRPIESVTITTEGHEGQYWCDPRSSFEEMAATIKFTPAYLRKNIDDMPHFEVLGAGYSRKLVALEA